MGDGMHDSRRGVQLSQELIKMDCAKVLRQRASVRLQCLNKTKKKAGKGNNVPGPEWLSEHNDHCSCWSCGTLLWSGRPEICCHKKAPLRKERGFHIQIQQLLEAKFCSELHDAHRFTESINVRGTGQGRSRAAGQSEVVILSAAGGDCWRSNSCIARVLEVCMV